LLRLIETNKLKYLAVFSPFSIDPSLSSKSLASIAKNTPGKQHGYAWGFPQQGEIPTKVLVSLATVTETYAGLWRTDATTYPACSGGPIVVDDALVGIMTKVAVTEDGEKISNQADMLPTYKFVRALSSQVPVSDRLKRVQEVFDQYSKGDNIDNESAYDVLLALSGLNPIESLKLLTILRGAKKGTLRDMIFDYYSPYFHRQEWMLSATTRTCIQAGGLKM
jgi:hypothetical protein